MAKAEYNGYTYDSKFEAEKAYELDMLMRAGEIDYWVGQVPIPVYYHGYKVCDYIIDFIVWHNGKIHPEGTLEYIETKGEAKDLWRLKWKLFAAMFLDLPNVVLTVDWQKSWGKKKSVTSWPKKAEMKTPQEILTAHRAIRDTLKDQHDK